MIVARLQRTFPQRAIEWFLAAITISIGFTMLQGRPVWGDPAFLRMLEMATASTWAVGVTLLGVVRLLALVINGAWRPSPHIRAGMAFLTCFVWTQITLSVYASGQVSLIWGIVPWLLVAEFYSMLRASSDARDADERAKVKKRLGELNHVRS